MAQSVPSSSRLPRIASLPEHREAAVSLLAGAAPSWDELATIVRRDPGLLHAILVAAPLSPRRLGTTLHRELAERLERLGADLLRAWLLQETWHASVPDERLCARARRALVVGECALHLALETRYPHPDEAFVAGLWHDLGALVEDGPHTATLTARLADRAGAWGPLADALAFGDGLDERWLAGHPLMRLVWAARRLSGDGWHDAAERVGTALGLAREAVLALRNDVGHLAAAHARATALPAAPDTAGTGEPASGSTAIALNVAGDPWRDVVLGALVRSGFSGPNEDVAGRFSMACRLLCDTPPPLVFAADEYDRLHALPLGDDPDVRTWYAELDLRSDDDTSLVARALRTGEETACDGARGGSPRSALDWHLGRWLGDSGITCLPLAVSPERAVAVAARGSLHSADHRLLCTLSAAAAVCVMQRCRETDARGKADQRVEARLRDHVRRIAHEACNPLSIVKSRLEMMAQRQACGDEVQAELDILHGELDRVAVLLKAAGQMPGDAAEAPSCHVPELLAQMQALYADPLFARRGIRFEVRCTASLPTVAIPPTALRQVLLNLFRNAAEALQPGGSFVVSVPGRVIANGAPCLEVRVIDNGPGLPPARLADLFAEQPSTKGGAHEGLGLSIVHEILNTWGASILCRSQPGSGTSFQLFIPLDH